MTYLAEKMVAIVIFYYDACTTIVILGYKGEQDMIQLCTPETVINILATKVGVPANTPEIETASWEDLGVDSLGLSEVVAGIWHLLGIELPHEEAMNTANVQELVALVNAQS